MTEIDKVYSFLGLACKAGKVVSGDETCERAILKGKVVLTIIAQDASDNTKKKFMDMCSYRAIDIKMFGNKEKLGKFVGKDIRSVVAVIDKGFGERMIEMINKLTTEVGGE